MTQDELDALPDATPRFGVRIEIRDGREVRIPVLEDGPGALYQGPNDPIMVTDVNGVSWMLGRVNGVLYKRRMGEW